MSFLTATQFWTHREGRPMNVLSKTRFTGTLKGTSSFRATDGHHRNCATSRHLAVDFQVVFHTQPACYRSIVVNVDHLCPRQSVVGYLRPAQSEPRHLRRQHYRTGDGFANGERHTDECRMDLLRIGPSR